MLPNILDVANEYDCTIGEIKDDEVSVTCPSKKGVEITCHLNIKKNVFFCSCCQTGGGVLKYERLLSGQSEDVLKDKYFRKKTVKKKYGAASLSLKQLQLIGWEALKSYGQQFYRDNHEKAWQAWLKYREERLTKLYAIFTVMMHIEDKDYGGKLYNYLLDTIEESEITNLSMEVFMDAAIGDIPNEWVNEGEILAKKAFKRCRELGDYSFNGAALLIMFDFHKCSLHLPTNSNLKHFSNKEFQDYDFLFDWNRFIYNMNVLSFALFVTMMNVDSTKIQEELYLKIYFMKKQSISPNFSMLKYINEYSMDEELRCDWAREGTRLARMGWRASGKASNKYDYVYEIFVQKILLQPFIENFKFEGAKVV